MHIYIMMLILDVKKIYHSAFTASLYHKLTTEDNQDDVHNKPITYGYSGTAYITQRNLWFYSCTLMTCVNMVKHRFW